MPDNNLPGMEAPQASTQQTSECALPAAAHSGRGKLRNFEMGGVSTAVGKLPNGGPPGADHQVPENHMQLRRVPKEETVLGKHPNGETLGSGASASTNRLNLQRVPTAETHGIALDADAQLEKFRASERKADAGNPDDKLKAVPGKPRPIKGYTP